MKRIFQGSLANSLYIFWIRNILSENQSFVHVQ